MFAVCNIVLPVHCKMSADEQQLPAKHSWMGCVWFLLIMATIVAVTFGQYMVCSCFQSFLLAAQAQGWDVGCHQTNGIVPISLHAELSCSNSVCQRWVTYRHRHMLNLLQHELAYEHNQLVLFTLPQTGVSVSMCIRMHHLQSSVIVHTLTPVWSGRAPAPPPPPPRPLERRREINRRIKSQ